MSGYDWVGGPNTLTTLALKIMLCDPCLLWEGPSGYLWGILCFYSSDMVSVWLLPWGRVGWTPCYWLEFCIWIQLLDYVVLDQGLGSPPAGVLLGLMEQVSESDCFQGFPFIIIFIADTYTQAHIYTHVHVSPKAISLVIWSILWLGITLAWTEDCFLQHPQTPSLCVFSTTKVHRNLPSVSRRGRYEGLGSVTQCFLPSGHPTSFHRPSKCW